MRDPKRSEREILAYSRVHKDMLPRGLQFEGLEHPEERVYQTYNSLLRHFKIWAQLQLKPYYAQPSTSMMGLLMMCSRRHTLRHIRDWEKEVAEGSADKPKEEKKPVDRQAEYKRLLRELTISIRRYLITWRIVDRQHAGQLAGRLARGMMTKPKEISLVDLAMKEVQEFYSPKHPLRYRLLKRMDAFAKKRLNHLRTRAVLRLAKRLGLAEAGHPFSEEEMAERRRQYRFMKRQCLLTRQYFVHLQQCHAELFATVAGEEPAWRKST